MLAELCLTFVYIRMSGFFVHDIVFNLCGVMLEFPRRQVSLYSFVLDISFHTSYRNLSSEKMTQTLKTLKTLSWLKCNKMPANVSNSVVFDLVCLCQKLNTFYLIFVS